jgi:uncharacterized protein
MPNRLAQAQSLYLRKHAENPIDWWSWGGDAIEAARQQNKPIFLSVGYSSCHWCTVMEGEAFSDWAIAEYLNANFLPIKVDREERPDVDSIYMQALQMMTGHGGWPLNIFLTPDELVPFYGGTYFPTEPRYNRPGFLAVLQSLRRFYDEDKTKLAEIRSQIMSGLAKTSLFNPVTDISESVLVNGLNTATSIIAGKGLAGGGPSFPMIPYAIAVMHGARFDVTQFGLEHFHDGAAVALKRGLDLALGGIFDHVAGGFHRYTVDPTWTVPHFEKMLYDNGQIVEYLANLYSAGNAEPAFERAISHTVAWLKREMTAPEGYFYAAQDADSFVVTEDLEPEEGAFYVWRHGELVVLLDDAELAALTEALTITPEGNFEGAIVLQRENPGELSPIVEVALGKLFVARYGTAIAETPVFPPARDNYEAKTYPWPERIPAVTDTKMIVAWNALMIAGLARSAIVFANLEYYQLAANAAQFVLAKQRPTGRLQRLYYDGEVAVSAQSEDYALLIKALLDLQQAAIALIPDAQPWLDAAVALQAEFDQYLWSAELGGYYNTASDACQDLILRERSYLDNATPAANGPALANLVRLGLLTGNLGYLDRAESGLQAFGSILQQTPQACPSLFGALDWLRHPILVRSSRETIADLARRYWPTVVFEIAAELPEGAVGLVCRGVSCDVPAESVAMMIGQMERAGFVAEI